jgi:hypothetical protein
VIFWEIESQVPRKVREAARQTYNRRSLAVSRRAFLQELSRLVPETGHGRQDDILFWRVRWNPGTIQSRDSTFWFTEPLSMPSPFPGMDPYLEDPSVWMDFHERFITYCSDALNDRLPDAYETRIEERVNLVALEDERMRSFRADVAISDIAEGQPGRPTGPYEGTTATLLAVEPVTIPLVYYEEEHESRIHILDRRNHRLVTVIELLSPTNKRGDGYFQYVLKRNALLQTRVHLVEIDLLVAGDRLPFKEALPAGHYFAYVARGDRRPDCQVYAWSIRQALSKIMIPLAAPDPDLALDLAELFTTTYKRGRYDRSLPYSVAPLAPLAADDLQWAAALGQSHTR